MPEIALIAHLPDPAKDQDLKDCPACHASPNQPGHHKGPTTIYFAKGRYQTLCLACGHRTLPGKNQEEAMQHWEDDTSARLLHQLRTEQGLNMLDLQALTGVSRETIRKMENDGIRGSYSTRSKLAKALGVSPHLI